MGEQLVGEDPADNKYCGEGKEKQLSDCRLEQIVEEGEEEWGVVGSRKGGEMSGWKRAVKSGQRACHMISASSLQGDTASVQS
jgi:hypothetical protein